MMEQRSVCIGWLPAKSAKSQHRIFMLIWVAKILNEVGFKSRWLLTIARQRPVGTETCRFQIDILNLRDINRI